MFHNRLPFAQVILNLAIMILRVIKILFVIPFMTKATEREQQRGILSLKRTFLPLLFGILPKKTYLCNAHL